jgi:hypothetical protein
LHPWSAAGALEQHFEGMLFSEKTKRSGVKNWSFGGATVIPFIMVLQFVLLQ